MFFSANNDPISNMLSTELSDVLSGPFLSTIILMFVVLILVIAINISSKKALKDPLKLQKDYFTFGFFLFNGLKRL